MGSVKTGCVKKGVCVTKGVGVRKWVVGRKGLGKRDIDKEGQWGKGMGKGLWSSLPENLSFLHMCECVMPRKFFPSYRILFPV